MTDEPVADQKEQRPDEETGPSGTGGEEARAEVAARDPGGEQEAPVERNVAVGVRFGPGEPVVYYWRGRVEVVPGDTVVAPVDRGVDLGVVASVAELALDALDSRSTVLRRASERDLARQGSLDDKQREALAYCQERIEAHGLPMRLIDCHCTLDGRRLVFYFSAEGRVDFRALVRDLARHFRCRIELRQVGVRDHARMLGGLGPCGRPLCCAQFLRNFEPVSIRAAKDQGIALNPGKLSGLCDRLMCCLLYEHQCYRDLSRNMPKHGTIIETPQGRGRVDSVNVLTQTIALSLEDGRRTSFPAAELGFGPQAAGTEEQAEEDSGGNDGNGGNGEAEEPAPMAQPRRNSGGKPQASRRSRGNGGPSRGAPAEGRGASSRNGGGAGQAQGEVADDKGGGDNNGNGGGGGGRKRRRRWRPRRNRNKGQEPAGQES